MDDYTCHIVASSIDGLCLDNPYERFELSCGHSFTLHSLDKPVTCPICGRVVETKLDVDVTIFAKINGKAITHGLDSVYALSQKMSSQMTDKQYHEFLERIETMMESGINVVRADVGEGYREA